MFAGVSLTLKNDCLLAIYLIAASAAIPLTGDKVYLADRQKNFSFRWTASKLLYQLL